MIDRKIIKHILSDLLKLLLCLGIFVIAFSIIFLGAYYDLISLRNEAKTKQIYMEKQLQYRYDFIPNLVKAIKDTMKDNSSDIFYRIKDYREYYLSTQTGTSSRLEAATFYDTEIDLLFAAMDKYPELKSNEQVTELMKSLKGTENRIAVAKQDYNKVAKKYNTVIQMFPTHIIAEIFIFPQLPIFEASDSQFD